MNSLQCDSVKIEVLDSTGCDDIFLEMYGTETLKKHGYPTVTQNYNGNELSLATVTLSNNMQPTSGAVVQVQYLKNGACVGSEVISDGNTQVIRLMYKVEMPANSKVNLFEEGFGNVAELQYNIPMPIAFAANTFLQAVSTNGYEYQDDAQAGSQTITLLPFLSGRYAVSAEFWTYETAQTIWFAGVRATLEDYSTKEIVPTAGTGGTIVTVLPQ